MADNQQPPLPNNGKQWQLRQDLSIAFPRHKMSKSQPPALDDLGTANDRLIASMTMHKTWDNGLGPNLEYHQPQENFSQKKQHLLALRDRMASTPGMTNARPIVPDGFFAEIREIPADYLAQFLPSVEIVARVLILEDALILELEPTRLNDSTMPRKAVEALFVTLPLG